MCVAFSIKIILMAMLVMMWPQQAAGILCKCGALNQGNLKHVNCIAFEWKLKT